VSEGRLILRDGRTLAWCEYGPPNGHPLLRFQGMPGSRYSRHPHEESYDRLHVRVIVSDRPGYGASTRLAGRGVAVVADDNVELLDHLGLDLVHVTGTSGGGPHALAFAALYPKRVQAATVTVGGAPLLNGDTVELIGLNRAAWFAARQGWEAMHALLSPVREDLLRDPLGAFRRVMDAAPAADKAVMDDPDWQRVLIEDQLEALNPGAEGWVDEAMAVMSPWDFDPYEVGCTLTWWHGEHDANAPHHRGPAPRCRNGRCGPATVEGGRASGVVPPARRDTCGASRSLTRLEPRQSVAHRDTVEAVVPHSSRQRPGDVKKGRKRSSRESAGQNPSSISAGSETGPENTLKVETRVRTPLGLQRKRRRSRTGLLLRGARTRRSSRTRSRQRASVGRHGPSRLFTRGSPI